MTPRKTEKKKQKQYLEIYSGATKYAKGILPFAFFAPAAHVRLRLRLHVVQSPPIHGWKGAPWVGWRTPPFSWLPTTARMQEVEQRMEQLPRQV